MDVPCDPNPCRQPAGACCYPDGHCEFVVESQCPTGHWLGNVPCDPNPCPPPTGACCNLETGACRVLTREECDRQTYPHQYLGDGTSCEPNPCPNPVPTTQTTWGKIKAHYR